MSALAAENSKPHWLIPEMAYASFDEYLLAYGGRSPLALARKKKPEAIIAELKRSGLRGRGGAGYPAGAKWASLREHPCRKRSVICNAAEGEPGTFKDRYLIRKNPYAVIAGLLIAAHVLETTEIYIGIKASYQKEMGRLRQAIAEMREHGLLDGIQIEIVAGPDEYLFGEEKALLEVIEGDPPLPREAHYPPYARGLYATLGSANPALVNNAETFARVPGILFHGADSFRKLGSKGTPGPVLFTVCGDVARPGVYELEAGLSLKELFEAAGGPLPGRRFKAALSGVSSGVIPAKRFDTPADFDALKAIGSGLGSAGFIVLDDSVSIPQAAKTLTRFLFVESCNQCPSCKVGLRTASTAFDDLCAGRKGLADHLVLAEEGARHAPEGNRCYLPVEGSILIPSLIKEFRKEFEGKGPSRGKPFSLPKIVDYDERARIFSYDLRQKAKQPDWTYSP